MKKFNASYSGGLHLLCIALGCQVSDLGRTFSNAEIASLLGTHLYQAYLPGFEPPIIVSIPLVVLTLMMSPLPSAILLLS